MLFYPTTFNQELIYVHAFSTNFRSNFPVNDASCEKILFYAFDLFFYVESPCNIIIPPFMQNFV